MGPISLHSPLANVCSWFSQRTPVPYINRFFLLIEYHFCLYNVCSHTIYTGLHASLLSILISVLLSEAMSLFVFWLVRLKTMELIRFSVYTDLFLVLLLIL